MRLENTKILESLSWYTHLGGLLSVCIGASVVLFDLFNQDFKHIQVGFYILVTGYAFVKISQKLGEVLRTESRL